MQETGLFWIAIVVLAIVAIAFIAMPLLKNNRKSWMYGVAIAVPILAAGLYSQLGSPEVDGSNHRSAASGAVTPASGGSGGDDKIGSVASMVDGLANKLKEDPSDGGSWLLLARSYKHLNRMDDAIAAYEKASALGKFDEDLSSLSGEKTEVVGSGGQIFGNVSLSEKATGIVQPTDTVFIFAKAVNGPPAPLAVLRRPASELPIDFLLNDSQSMVAGVKLSDFDEVVVTARITRGGNAAETLQDLEARTDVVVLAENRHLKLTIE